MEKSYDDIKVDTEGNMYYYLGSMLHNTEGPAKVMINGDKSYYQYGILHNEIGPASIINGVETFYIKGNPISREDFYFRKRKIIIAKL